MRFWTRLGCWISNLFHRHRARRIEFTFGPLVLIKTGGWVTAHQINCIHIGGRKKRMAFTMRQDQSVSVIGSPVDASGNPSKATLSLVNYGSSDTTVFTVAPDPNTPNGAIIKAVGPGTATLDEKATATEPDGKTTEIIEGQVVITITAVPPPPPPPAPAASIVFTFGVPTPA